MLEALNLSQLNALDVGREGGRHAPPFIIDPGAGNVALEADPATGKLYLVGHDAHLASYDCHSAASMLTNSPSGGGYATLSGTSAPLWELIAQSAGDYV